MAEIRELGGSPPISVSVGTGSTQILSSLLTRKKVIIVNDGSVPVYLCRGPSATLNAGIRLNANGGTLVDEPDTLGRIYTGVWSGIASVTAIVTVSEDR